MENSPLRFFQTEESRTQNTVMDSRNVAGDVGGFSYRPRQLRCFLQRPGKTQENRLKRLEMKANRLFRRHPDWRRDGARNNELAGAKRLTKMREQSRHVADSVNQFSSQRFKIGSVGQLFNVPRNAPARSCQRTAACAESQPLRTRWRW